MTTKQFKKVALGDCCEIISGSTPSRNKAEYWDGEIAWFTPKDLSRIKSKYISEAPEKITTLGLKSCSTTLLPKNTLLLSSRAPIGHIAITTIEACTNQGFKSLVPNKNLDVEYLFYAIKNIIPQLKDMGNGATFKEISKSTLSKVEIPLTQLTEQKQIAAILDAADSLRQKDQQLVEHYTALSQSLFLEMFGDDSQFPSISAGEVIDIRDGTHDSPKYVDEGFPLITSKNIKNGDLDFSSVNFISEADYDQIQKRSAASVGDIIMPMIGTIGNPHLITKQPNYAIKNVALFKFHKSDQVKNVFIYYLLNSQYFERYVASKNKGGTQKFISLGDLRKMPIFVPPITLQNQFAERVAIIEQQKQQAQTNLQKSEALFKSLLQRAFTGELTADKAA